MKTRKRVHMTDLNPSLTCMLCRGYLIDATTVTECLHSFCKTCIVKFLEKNKHCPVCSVVVHKTRPQLHIRSDKTLQDLVYKLVPGLYKNEMKRRRDYYKQNPHEAPSKAGEDRGDETAERTLYTEDEKFSVALHFGSRAMEDEQSIRALTLTEMGVSVEEQEKVHYLLCPAGVTTDSLKKFIRTKYDLVARYQVDILHSEESLPDDFTLIDVAYMYNWRRKEPLKLTFSVYEYVIKRMRLGPLGGRRLLCLDSLVKQETKDPSAHTSTTQDRKPSTDLVKVEAVEQHNKQRVGEGGQENVQEQVDSAAASKAVPTAGDTATPDSLRRPQSAPQTNPQSTDSSCAVVKSSPKPDDVTDGPNPTVKNDCSQMKKLVDKQIVHVKSSPSAKLQDKKVAVSRNVTTGSGFTSSLQDRVVNTVLAKEKAIWKPVPKVQKTLNSFGRKGKSSSDGRRVNAGGSTSENEQKSVRGAGPNAARVPEAPSAARAAGSSIASVGSDKAVPFTTVVVSSTPPVSSTDIAGCSSTKPPLCSAKAFASGPDTASVTVAKINVSRSETKTQWNDADSLISKPDTCEQNEVCDSSAEKLPYVRHQVPLKTQSAADFVDSQVSVDLCKSMSHSISSTGEFVPQSRASVHAACGPHSSARVSVSSVQTVAMTNHVTTSSGSVSSVVVSSTGTSCVTSSLSSGLQRDENKERLLSSESMASSAEGETTRPTVSQLPAARVLATSSPVSSETCHTTSLIGATRSVAGSCSKPSKSKPQAPKVLVVPTASVSITLGSGSEATVTSTLPSAAAGAAGAVSPSPAALAASSSPSPPMASSAAGVKHMVEPSQKQCSDKLDPSSTPQKQYMDKSGSSSAPSQKQYTDKTGPRSSPSLNQYMDKSCPSSSPFLKEQMEKSDPSSTPAPPQPVTGSSVKPLTIPDHTVPLKDRCTHTAPTVQAGSMVNSSSCSGTRASSADKSESPVPAVSMEANKNLSAVVTAPRHPEPRETEPVSASSSSSSKVSVSTSSECSITNATKPLNSMDAVCNNASGRATQTVSAGPPSALTSPAAAGAQTEPSRNGMPRVITKPSRASKHVATSASPQKAPATCTSSGPLPGAPGVRASACSHNGHPNVSQHTPTSTTVPPDPAARTAPSQPTVSPLKHKPPKTEAAASGGSVKKQRRSGCGAVSSPGQPAAVTAAQTAGRPSLACGGSVQSPTNLAALSPLALALAHRAQQAQQQQQFMDVRHMQLMQQQLLNMQAVAALTGYLPSPVAFSHCPLVSPSFISSAAVPPPLGSPPQSTDSGKQPTAGGHKKPAHPATPGKKAGDTIVPKKKIADIANVLHKKMNQTLVAGTDKSLDSSAEKQPPCAHSASTSSSSCKVDVTGATNLCLNTRLPPSVLSRAKDDEPLNLVMKVGDTGKAGSRLAVTKQN